MPATFVLPSADYEKLSLVGQPPLQWRLGPTEDEIASPITAAPNTVDYCCFQNNHLSISSYVKASAGAWPPRRTRLELFARLPPDYRG